MFDTSGNKTIRKKAPKCFKKLFISEMLAMNTIYV